ncbi:hypothetical protein, partial [Vibrio campbellii]|uniref:hypothetical protein n=1 Tax=Vibrio campbellii TaxID=680 RepID=UPI001D11DD93
EQRIPNPRVGSSNLSTPAIFKALVKRLEPFSYLYLKAKAVDSPDTPKQRVLEVGGPAQSNLWNASPVHSCDI